jgi:cytochrome c-type biogenesis protein CcmH
MNKWLLAALFFLTPLHFALAFGPDAPLADATQEARARALFRDIRCVVCQSEPIADSPSKVAADMRALVRERIAAGDSDEAILSFLRQRYGDVILMTPPFSALTWALWLGPALVTLLAALSLRAYFRRSGGQLQ